MRTIVKIAMVVLVAMTSTGSKPDTLSSRMLA
jgi:hypothetical protein